MNELIHLYIYSINELSLPAQNKTTRDCVQYYYLNKRYWKKNIGTEKKLKKLIIRPNLALSAQQDDSRLRAVLCPQ